MNINVHTEKILLDNLPRLGAYVIGRGQVPLARHPSWLVVLEQGLGHVPYCLEAVEGGRVRGLLALAFVRSPLFGRFLVSLPYVNYGGVLGDDDRAAGMLIDRAVCLADQLDARYLELRHEEAQVWEHPALIATVGAKVHMRLSLPTTADELWGRLPPKVRNQVRKGQKAGLTVDWGGEELLPDFYDVFSRNMRDLGTPAFGRGLFGAATRQFPDRVEFCVVRTGGTPVAAALLAHGWGVTEVPSAGSLRSHNAMCCNMTMYWSLLERAIRRGQKSFDFGRSSPGSGTYQFKKQWGAAPEPAAWQHYTRVGSAAEMRPDHPRYRLMVRLWKRLPVALARRIGPPIVRGIP